MAEQGLARNPLAFKPVGRPEWADLQALFSAPGAQHGCWCMYWRMTRAEFQRHYGEDNRLAMEQIIASGRVPGILAYLQGQPVGWCSVAPREEFPTLDRSPTLKRVDSLPVWSIVCFFVSRPYRRQGMTAALIDAAVAYAKANGATVVEAYPLLPEKSADPRYQLYTGVASTFARLGFREAIRRSRIRPIMRRYIGE